MQEPIKLLEPQKRMPFTLAVAVRLLVLIPIFGMSIFMIIAGYLGVQKGNRFELSSLIMGILFFLLSSIMLFRIFVSKKRQLAQLQYLFYTDRLVIYNKVKDQVLHELFYDQFPAFTFHENLNNFGYIVIGKEEPVMARGGVFGQNTGVNMKDSEMMLENLPEVKKVYVFLKELVDAAEKNAVPQ